jgi:hypothetical protein
MHATSRTGAFAVIAFVSTLGAPSPAAADASAPPIAVANAPDRIALRGYDPVAYFTDGKPARGLPELTATHKGAIYRYRGRLPRAQQRNPCRSQDRCDEARGCSRYRNRAEQESGVYRPFNARLELDTMRDIASGRVDDECLLYTHTRRTVRPP